MLQLKCNGRVYAVGEDDVMALFELKVRTWNDEASGWDDIGNFWTVRELPDVIEYQPSEWRRTHTVHPKQQSLMLETREQMHNCARLYAKLGYRYIIGWRDVRGFGLNVTHFADWQTPDSAPYINLRES